MEYNLNIKWFSGYDPTTGIQSINGVSYEQGTTGINLAAANPQWWVDVDENNVQTLCTITTGQGDLTLVDSNNSTFLSTNPEPIVIGTCILIGGRKPHHP